jgi:hypothetical protein
LGATRPCAAELVERHQAGLEGQQGAPQGWALPDEVEALPQVALGVDELLERGPKVAVEAPDHCAEVVGHLVELPHHEARAVGQEAGIEACVGDQRVPYVPVRFPGELGEDGALRLPDQCQHRDLPPGRCDQLCGSMQVVGEPDRPSLRQLEGVHREGSGRPRVTVNHQLGLGADHLGAGPGVLAAGKGEVDGRVLRRPGPQQMAEATTP